MPRRCIPAETYVTAFIGLAPTHQLAVARWAALQGLSIVAALRQLVRAARRREAGRRRGR